MRIVRYLGVLTLLRKASLWPSSGYPFYSPHIKATQISRPHRFAESIPHLGCHRDSFIHVRHSIGQISASRDGANTPFQTSRTPGKVTDDKEACETTRPKIDKTAFKAGQRGCSRESQNCSKRKVPSKKPGKRSDPSIPIDCRLRQVIALSGLWRVNIPNGRLPALAMIPKRQLFAKSW